MERTKEGVGVLVIGGLTLFAVGMYLIGDRHELFARHIEYYAEFISLAGIQKGSAVRVAGMNAGEVLAIEVPDSPSSRFRVRWRIDVRFHGLIRVDSVATIGTEGVVGGTYLSVKPGSANARPAAELGTIPSREPTDLSELLARGSGLLDDAKGMLSTVGNKLAGTLDTVRSTTSNVNDIVVDLKTGRGTAGMLIHDRALAAEIRADVTTATSNLREIVADLKNGRGVAGMTLRDEVLADRVRDAVTHAQKAAANLSHASGEADAMVSALSSRQTAQKVAELVDRLNDSAQNIQQLLAEIQQPDPQGVDAGVNIRESLAHANTALANLADATEALKHNFFTRGFFKDRGYYSLEDLSPDAYRRDRMFARTTNRRVWLRAAELFQGGANGEEELSPHGKTLLNTALIDLVDSIIAGPLVIEGYSTDDESANQLRLSRSRALAVREYFQSQFHLDTKHLGAVPLRNEPPDGLGRATWNGICLVALRATS